MKGKLLDQIKIVLVEPSHPGNIGGAARAMKTMGLSELSLVKPRKFPSGEANALSGNATDVLENAKIFDSIEDAINFNLYHEGLHMGYILAIKRFLADIV